MTWSHPLALLLLLLVPVYVYFERSGQAAIPLPRSTQLRESGRSAAPIAAIPIVLRTLVLCALALAIAGPATAGAVVEERSEGVPIVLAIDISSSMLAQDFQPRDRLTVAKGAIARFAENRPSDPIGLVAFAAEAITLVPTTLHRPILASSIASLQVGLLEDGTALGDGLATALNRLRGLESERGGVVVLLSDGESNRGTIDPLAAADAAASLGVQVFTVGVGSESVASVPISAGPAGFQYAELAVGLDEELLREIASRTGGEYFRATDGETLERIYGEIDARVPSAIETTRVAPPKLWSGFLLLLGATLLLLEWGVRASRWGSVP